MAGGPGPGSDSERVWQSGWLGLQRAGSWAAHWLFRQVQAHVDEQSRRAAYDPPFQSDLPPTGPRGRPRSPSPSRLLLLGPCPLKKDQVSHAVSGSQSLLGTGGNSRPPPSQQRPGVKQVPEGWCAALAVLSGALQGPRGPIIPSIMG